MTQSNSLPIMEQARLDCMLWSVQQDDILQRFLDETGCPYAPPKNAIEKQIDDATGAGVDFCKQFEEWFNKNIWGEDHDTE